MPATIIDGKALAAKCKERIKGEVEALHSRPGLAVIIVGDNPASRVYVTSKEKDCAQCGIYSEEYALPENTRQAELLDLIDQLNGQENIDGILVQLPLPVQFDEKRVIEAIIPGKDVDCFHPYNVGRLMTGESGFLPCTPAGVMEMLDEYGIDPKGKHCVIVGRSNIVGKPQAMLMLRRDATVTICHSKTPDLGSVTRTADILVAAVGRCGLITADMVKPGAVVIDVAMNHNEAGKLCGDVCFPEVADKASY
ncbi:MAG: tetrahydrofolate dehydrogenase/cyclohydrolase catalytic domain-containing protein, partial [Pseudoflavonifractor sp.]